MPPEMVARMVIACACISFAIVLFAFIIGYQAGRYAGRLER